jgi:thioredoxin-like negative regulator of GroEL
MRILHGIAALLLAAAPEHGRLDWFDGSFEQALAKAKAEKKILFIDFWAGWCGWCKRFDIEALSDSLVVAETRDLVCITMDAESEVGVSLAARYGVSGLPSLVFVEADGSLRDRLSGFRTAPQFIQEIRRIRANEGTLGEIERQIAEHPDDLLARLELVVRLRRMHEPRWQPELAEARRRIEGGIGFDPKDPDARFEIARKLRMCGDEKGYQEHVALLVELDPEGRSASRRRLALNQIVEDVHSRYRKERLYAPDPIVSFLANEEHPSVRFEGYAMLHGMASYQTEDALRQNRTDLVASMRAEARRFARLAWKDCPSERIAGFGREVVQGLLADRELDEEGLAFALELATRASQAALRSAEALELLGECLARAGKRTEAIEVFRKALEIDPERRALVRRIEELER